MSEKKIQEFYARVPLEKKIGEPQKGRMKVGSQILEQLSRGIYSTPEMAIKELLSNSFDADATEVIIDTKSSPGSILISDNGHGMDYKDFDENYTYISKSPKVGKNQLTPTWKRPVIGRLGIGFIAVSALCDTMIVSSAKKDSDTRFIAILDFSKFKGQKYADADFYDVSEYTLTNYEKKRIDESYTRIELKDLTEPFENILYNKPEKGVRLSRKKLSGFADFVRNVWNTKDHIIVEKKFGPYWRFVMRLASIIPVAYLENGPIRKNSKPELIKPIKENVSKLNFKVKMDGMELRKPYLFPTLNKLYDKDGYDVLPFTDSVLASNGNRVSYTGYMYSQDGGILVEDWRGLVVRIRNTSIGILDPTFLSYPHEGDSLYYKWTFGEIYVTEGLEDAMNVDRATFKTGDPEYYEFIQSVHNKLKKEIFNAVQKRWRKRTEAKRQELEKIKQNWRMRSTKKAFKTALKIIKTEDPNAKPITINLQKKILEINSLNKVLATFPIKEQKFLQDILFAVAISRERYPTNPRKQDELLLDLLEDLGRKYPKPSLKFEYQKRDE